MHPGAPPWRFLPGREPGEPVARLGGGAGAVGQLEGVDGDPAGIAGGVEVGEQVRPVGVAPAHRGGAGATVDAAGGVAGAGVADQVAELREGLVEVPLVTEDRDRIEVDAEPGAARLAQGAVEGGERRELAAEGEYDAV